jgi:hypothetical protein
VPVTAKPPQILVPAAPIGTIGDRTIFLLVVELWRNEVTLRLAGIPSWRDVDLELEPDILTGDAIPVTHEMDAVRLHITDDLGTSFKLHSGQGEGTDMEWRADWHYRPGVPSAATELRIHTVDRPPLVLELASGGEER